MPRERPRLHVSGPLDAGLEVTVSPGQAHYLAQVMRLAPGDTVLLFNGASGEWSARIARQKRGEATLMCEAQTRVPTPEPDLWLAFALLKREATELVVQKATELGVSALLPVLTERTNTARVNLERVRAIAVEASEQSERLSVPEVRAPVRLEALFAGWPASRRLAAAIERSGPSVFPSDAGGLLVGPEGGFSPGELEFIRRKPFISAVSLGPRVLRAETAAIAGLALLQSDGWQGRDRSS